MPLRTIANAPQYCFGENFLREAAAIEMSYELIVAIKAGHLEEVRRLIDTGVDVNQEDAHGFTPLMWAPGFTPLMEAAIYGHTEVAVELIKAKADVNHQNNNERTPLIVATDREKDEDVKMIKRDEIYFDAKEGGAELVMELIKAKADVNHQDKDGATALLYASFHGRAKAMSELIKAGVDINHQDKDGWTPLIKATSAWHAHIEVATELIKAGADINHKDNRGHTARYHAKQAKRLDMVLLLDQTHLLQSAVRQWCRIFCTPAKFSTSTLAIDSDSHDLERSPDMLLIDFFATYPGLRRVIGGRIVRYFNPATAKSFKKSRRCLLM